MQDSFLEKYFLVILGIKWLQNITWLNLKSILHSYLMYIYCAKVTDVFKEVAASSLLPLHQNFLKHPCTVARLQTHHTLLPSCFKPLSQLLYQYNNEQLLRHLSSSLVFLSLFCWSERNENVVPFPLILCNVLLRFYSIFIWSFS